MALNTTQRRTLIETIKVAIDGIIASKLAAWLPRCIAANQMTLQQSFTYITTGYIDQLAEATNVPVEVRADWRQFRTYVADNNTAVPRDLLQKLRAHPNYDPLCLAEMLRFTAEVEALRATLPDSQRGVCDLMICLREIYLEMTPFYTYQYGSNYRQFCFRLGDVPCNLDHFGDRPVAGEIQADVERYTQERIEINEEKEKEIQAARKEEKEKAEKSAALKIQQLEDELKKMGDKENDLRVAPPIPQNGSELTTNSLSSSSSSSASSSSYLGRSGFSSSSSCLSSLPLTATTLSTLSLSSQVSAVGPTARHETKEKEIQERTNTQESHYSLAQLEEAAANGDAHAQAMLGRAYFHGEGVVKDINQASEWFQLAARQINTSAGQYAKGRCYGEGFGVTKDLQEAVRFYRLSANQGFFLAQIELGLCYELGTGVDKDQKEAVTWYRRAANQECAPVQTYLGLCYGFGTGVDKDQKEAVSWYRRAAEQGYATAQTYLGVCYECGTGVDKDQKEAVTWYRRAAKQGNATAQNNLGVCYLKGKGVAKDKNEAVTWYRRAADQGLDYAQYNLGVCYENGAGVGKDLNEAARYYALAASKGLREAKLDLERLQEEAKQQSSTRISPS